MSLQSKRVTEIAQRVRALRAAEREAASKYRRILIWTWRWALMLYHEFLRDDVKIRAESLAFLMLFSLMPLLAGGFFVFTVFAQFGMVQDALQGGVENFLSTIPGEHRDFVQQYVLRFKDSYLSSISQKSSSIGIFALFILIWVGLQTFNNIDRTLNFIWSSDRQRPFSEQLRNFFFIVVAAPIVVIGGLSVPLILQRISAANSSLDSLLVLVSLINHFIAPAMMFGTFAVMYRYVPVRNVKWKPAFTGALFAMVLLMLANSGMRLYFAIGTQTAYGKAAAVPLFAFWLYLAWMIVILGAEVSFLMQNEKDVLASSDREPALKEGEGMLTLIGELLIAHREGKGAVDFDRLRMVTGLSSAKVHGILDFLNRRKIALECTTPEETEEGKYVLAKDVSEVETAELVLDFFKGSSSLSHGPLEKLWRESLDHWASFFKGSTLSDLVPANGKRKR